LLELALPFVAVGGYLLAYQGPAVQESLVTYKGLEKKFGAKLVKVVKGDVADSERVFVLLKKIKSTPKRFPRPAGIPKKEPLQG
jgi:16S rRNA (guanine527-N7)-methyltransferase